MLLSEGDLAQLEAEDDEEETVFDSRVVYDEDTYGVHAVPLYVPAVYKRTSGRLKVNSKPILLCHCLTSYAEQYVETAIDLLSVVCIVCDHRYVFFELLEGPPHFFLLYNRCQRCRSL